MEPIEQTLQKNRRGTPYVYGKNKRFNTLLNKYTQGEPIDEDKGYEYSLHVFDDLLGERTEKWVKANKKKLQSMDEREAMVLYLKQVDKFKQGLKKEFPQEAKRVEDEYSRRQVAQEQADKFTQAHDKVVSEGKIGLDMNKADQAILNDPNYVNPVGSTADSLQEAQNRQDDLHKWAQDE